MGLYWRIEKRVRELEAASGSVVGATGALYAVRRELVPEVPAETILDDVFIPMNVARKGLRVGFDPRARAWDTPDLGREREFRRKVRTLTGNYQLLQLAPWLLRRENPLRFDFISHKLTRLVVPFASAGGAGRIGVVAGTSIPDGFLVAGRILCLEPAGVDSLAAWSGVAAGGRGPYLCGFECGCPGCFWQLADWTHRGLGTTRAAEGSGWMKILWVKANKILPVHSGGDIRSFNIVRQLRKAGRTDLSLLL